MISAPYATMPAAGVVRDARAGIRPATHRTAASERFASEGMMEELDTFPRLLLHHAKVRPNAPATREKDLGIWQTWTWAEVAAEVRALACGLAAQGFGRGMHLAIIGDNRPRLY